MDIWIYSALVVIGFLSAWKHGAFDFQEEP
jgi:hypothetical protein